MARKLTDQEVTDLIHSMGELLFAPDGTKYEAQTPFSQARLETALRILLIAVAGQQREKERPKPRLVSVTPPEPPR